MAAGLVQRSVNVEHQAEEGEPALCGGSPALLGIVKATRHGKHFKHRKAFRRRRRGFGESDFQDSARPFGCSSLRSQGVGYPRAALPKNSLSLFRFKGFFLIQDSGTLTFGDD